MPNVTRIAVVGHGLVGRRHAAIVNNSADFELVAIVDPSDEAAAAAGDLGIPIFSELAAMLASVAPDGIVVATPTPMHLEQGLIAVDHKCPVLIEKPVTVMAAEAMELSRAAHQAGVPILVGHHRRHNGMIAAAKSEIEAGTIGRIRAIQATCWFYKPDSYFDVAPWRKHKGAGPISVNLVHDVDLLRHFCGAVTSVQAVARPSERGYDNEDLATAILSFQSGAVATISVSDSIVSPWSWELTSRENPVYPVTQESCYLIGGTRGGLSLPDLRVWHHETTPDWWSPIAAKSLKSQSPDPLVEQLRHFAQVIHGRETPLVSCIEGTRSLQVVEAIAAAAETGAPVAVTEFSI